MLLLNTEIEKAIYIRNISELKKIPKNYNRIYFGKELCADHFPSINTIKEILEFSNLHNMKFSLLTPIIHEHNIEKIKKILSWIKKIADIEIIINDYGIINSIKKSKATLSYGRLLNKFKKDPRIISLNISESQKINDMYFDDEGILDFFNENRISRIELDNLIEGINFTIPNKIKASLYVPYVHISAQKCIWKINNSCNEQCKNTKIQKFKQFKTPIYYTGKAQFIKNNKIPKYLLEKGIDRIVHMLNPPL